MESDGAAGADIKSEMLDEALRIGSTSASRASLYMQVAKDLMRGIEEAVRLMESGMNGQARDLLRKVQKDAARKVTRHKPTADVARVVEHFCNGDTEHKNELVIALLRELGVAE